jgi:site-specific DNA-methyltransferase (adenine-specific)
MRDRAIAGMFHLGGDADWTMETDPNLVDVFADSEEVTVLPTADYIRLLLSGVAREGETILDPFCGSGSTLVAAEQLGMCGVGIEVDPLCFEGACKKVEQAVAQGRMDFGEARPKPVQETMDMDRQDGGNDGEEVEA